MTNIWQSLKSIIQNKNIDSNEKKNMSDIYDFFENENDKQKLYHKHSQRTQLQELKLIALEKENEYIQNFINIMEKRKKSEDFFKSQEELKIDESLMEFVTQVEEVEELRAELAVLVKLRDILLKLNLNFSTLKAAVDKIYSPEYLEHQIDKKFKEDKIFTKKEREILNGLNFSLKRLEESFQEIEENNKLEIEYAERKLQEQEIEENLPIANESIEHDYDNINNSERKEEKFQNFGEALIQQEKEKEKLQEEEYSLAYAKAKEAYCQKYIQENYTEYKDIQEKYSENGKDIYMEEEQNKYKDENQKLFQDSQKFEGLTVYDEKTTFLNDKYKTSFLLFSRDLNTKNIHTGAENFKFYVEDSISMSYYKDENNDINISILFSCLKFYSNNLKIKIYSHNKMVFIRIAYFVLFLLAYPEIFSQLEKNIFNILLPNIHKTEKELIISSSLEFRNNLTYNNTDFFILAAIIAYLETQDNWIKILSIKQNTKDIQSMEISESALIKNGSDMHNYYEKYSNYSTIEKRINNKKYRMNYNFLIHILYEKYKIKYKPFIEKQIIIREIVSKYLV